MREVDDLSRLKPELRIEHGKPMFHQQDPDWLQTDSTAFDSLLEIREPVSPEDLQGLLPRLVKWPHEYPGDAELTYPRRVLAVDVGDLRMEPESEEPPQRPHRTD